MLDLDLELMTKQAGPLAYYSAADEIAYCPKFVSKLGLDGLFGKFYDFSREQNDRNGPSMISDSSALKCQKWSTITQSELFHISAM